MKCCKVARSGLTSWALLLSWVAVAQAENWPQWRGPTNDGISNETNLPAELSASKNLAWKCPLPGMGGSTPAIWGQRIFLTSEEGQDVVLMCLSTQGQPLWKTKIGAGNNKKRFMKDEGNQASPSPSTDGKHVWAFFGTGDFLCCDFAGNIVWKFNAQKRYGKFQIQHGMHISPLLHRDRLYHALLHSGGWWVYALDKATGKEIWKIRRDSDATDENEHSYASPLIWTDGNKEYLVIHGCDYATAHRLEDGSEIWRVGDLNPRSRYEPTLRFVATPAVSADLIVIPSAKNGPLVAIKPEATGMVKAGSRFEQWRLPGKTPQKGARTPDVPAPLIYKGLVYLCREYRPIRDFGAVVCLDAKSGAELYFQAIHPARYRASPVLADGKIFFASRDGVVTVIKLGPKFEVLAVNKMPDQIAASPAIANGRIYIRGFSTLYAISEGGK